MMRLGCASTLVILCLIAACSTPAQRQERFSQQVLDAAKQVKKRSGIDGETIPIDDARYRDYLGLVMQKIKVKWGYPCVKDTASGHCEYKSARLAVVFGITKDGRVPAFEVAEGSAYAIYDEYATNAIRLAQPFLPVPDAIAKDHTGIVIALAFRYVFLPQAAVSERGRGIIERP